MAPVTKLWLAYVAARIKSGRGAMYILDLQSQSTVRIGGTIDGDRVSLYDYDRGSLIWGTLPHLTDSATNASACLRFDGSAFTATQDYLGERAKGRLIDLDVEIEDADGISVYRLIAV